MSLFIASIASGSNGNCYYVGTAAEAVLVDVGISCREVEKRMKAIGLDIASVKAIFVSHEHSDHISGLPMLSNKHSIPVYITPGTQRNGRFSLRRELVRSFTADEPVAIGSLLITPFSKKHDAADPYSFTVAGKRLRVGVITDVGTACANVVSHFSQCHAVFLESNYDREMLDKGNYPYYLKNRIRGGQGHLSNEEALQLFNDHRAPFLSHLVLSHLSKNNNCPTLVEDLFRTHASGVSITVAPRYAPTPVFEITGSGAVLPVSRMMAVPEAAPAQLSFF